MHWYTSPHLAVEFLRLQIAGFHDLPFVRFKSGILAPMYFDGRMIPGIVDLYKQVLRAYEENWYTHLRMEVGSRKDVIIASVATGGISVGGMLADRLSLSNCFVRTQKKPNGTKSLIEKINVAGKTVIVFEDVVSRAESSGPVIRTLQENGAKVRFILSHFSYDFQESKAAFAEMGIEHFSLVPFKLLREKMPRALSAQEIAIIDEWHADPDTWTRKMEEKHPELQILKTG